jgi:pyrroloquinoline quinone (PQQ) biosynthesis protein C
MNEEDWRNHVLEGSTECVDEKVSESIIKGWVRTYAAEADAAMDSLRTAMQSNAVVQAHRQKAETLLRRWGQIKEICESALEAIDL